MAASFLSTDAPPARPGYARPFARYVKPILDRVGAALLIVALFPLMAILALGVLVATGRPVFFHQARAGLRGRTFRLIKYRTMCEARRADGALLPDSERLTPFARFLRRTSLDELPELLNVLAGDMSLVGPRPLLVHYLPRYTPAQARRHEVRPGITGWAQVNGRNATSWDQRFAMDVWYVDHLSLGLDVRILARTVAAVLRARGVSAAGHATMPEFTGTEQAG